jgi:hypothetical protein
MSNTLYFILLTIFLPAPFLFFWLIYILVDKRANRTIELLPKNELAKYVDVRIWFKGYDMFKRNYHRINPFRILYSYNIADLFLFDDQLIVLGKIKAFGKIRLLPPFAISWTDKRHPYSNVIHYTRYLGTGLTEDDIDIQFKDPDYTNNIKLAVKKVGRDLFAKMKLVTPHEF